MDYQFVDTPIYIYIDKYRATLGLQSPYGMETKDYSLVYMKELLTQILVDINKVGVGNINSFIRAFERKGMEMGFQLECWDDQAYEKYLGG